MVWLGQSATLMLSVLILFGPGLLIGWTAGLRGLRLWAFAPVITTAVASVLAAIYPVLGLRWSVLAFAIGVLVFAGLAWAAARWIFPPRVPERPGNRALLLLAGLVVGGVLIGIRLALYIGEPDAISQSNDAVFHLNALRYIVETGSASSFTLTGLVGASSFYPAAWHALVYLVGDLTGSDASVAINSVSLVIAALIWPLGIAWMTRVVTGSSVAAALAAALSGAMLHFPMLMFEWGVLYPNALALALVPAAVGIAIDKGSQSESRRWQAIAHRVLLASLAVVALGFAQPVAVLTWLLLMGSVAFARVVLAGTRPRGMHVALLSCLVVIIAGVWLVMAYVAGGSLWGPYANGAEALGELALSAQVDLPPSPVVSAVALLGLWVAWRTKSTRWLAIAWAGLAVLMFAVTAIANPAVRRWVLGPWYADPYRIAATLPIVMVPLMAIALVWGLGKLKKALPVARYTDDELGRTAVVLIAIIGALTLVLWPSVMLPVTSEGKSDQESRYESSEDSFLSPDEQVLLERLNEVVTPGSLIIANPSTGAAFGYALSGANVYPRTWSQPDTAAWGVISAHLRDASERDEVCEALRAYSDARYVLDFGPGDTSPGRTVLPGMTGFDSVEGFELIAAEGDAELWRITACDPSV